MQTPFFFQENLALGNGIIFLSEESSRHAATVLRMKVGDQLRVTDGKGSWILGEISDNDKKKCAISIIESGSEKKPSRKIIIAISLLKNSNRFEWFLEKATEIGIDEIIPMICTRTERQHFRYDRMYGIMQSAMLQSQQVWLPDLRNPTTFELALQMASGNHNDCQKLIAHCGVESKQVLSRIRSRATCRIILIGPEGDFTNEEIAHASQKQYLSVSLGDTRLRTETAGIVAASLLNIL